MKTFLEYVAADIVSKYGTDLHSTVVIFPNKRASLFLNGALATISKRPLWSPVYMTISEFFCSHSQLHIADPVKLVCDLHRVYTEVTGFDEDLDHFYGWGQLLAADFDDIDKHLAPTKELFANLSGIHEMDDISYLTEEQKAVIRKFFSNFSDDHNSLIKERFLRLWANMDSIYHAYDKRLYSQGLAYEGALYRKVVQDGNLAFDYDRYLFVGFNKILPVEQQLFTQLKRQGKAHFYWDFDDYYLQSEAGLFIRQQMELFPNELAIDSDVYRNFHRQKEIKLLSAATENIQARYVTEWLNEERISAGRRTAIVICNEALLPTVIHCLPPAVDQVNITSGYPLQQTAIASAVERMLREKPLNDVIDYVTRQAKQPENADDPFASEAHFRTYTLLNRIKTLIDNGDMPGVTPHSQLLQSIVCQLIQQTAIPFHGEPAVGLQVMGLLETRNLDFDHLLLLSANEGNLPRGLIESSFIPYSLRRAFELTTADHKASISAYHFYRLLSRARDVTIVYSNATVDGQAAEMSRFVLQLMVEDSYHHIVRHTLQAGQQICLQKPHSIEKTESVMDTLRQRFGLLTPTAINRYMRCPLQFYFCYVEGLREPDDTEDGIIDDRIFGNIFHNAAQMLYERLTQQSATITAANLEQLLKSKVEIQRAVDDAFDTEFKKVPTGGMAIINRQVIIHYLTLLITVDKQLAPFTVIGLEKDVTMPIHVPTLGKTITIGGRIDRLDSISPTTLQAEQQIRIIDYKTGSYHLRPLRGVDDIFDDSQLRNHTDYYLQTMLYARIVSRQLTRPVPVAPALLFIQHAAADDFNPILKFGTDYINDVATPEGDHFVQLLNDKVNEIFDSRRPFTPTTDDSRCQYCPYAHICGL